MPRAMAMLFLIFAGLASGQPQKGISQSTGGACSPAVISGGDVTITCAGLDSQQREMLRKIPAVIDQLLKRNQADRDEILAKLEEILRLQRDAEARDAQAKEAAAPRRLRDDQKGDLAKVLAHLPKGRFIIKASILANDARAYADEIAAYFTDKLGWTVRVDNAIITGPNTIGIWITVRDPKAPPDVAGALQQAFRAAHIEVRGEYDPAGPPPDEVWLSIGPKR